MRRPGLVPLVLALAAVYVFWGSTAPAIRVAVQSFPPWYLAAFRFLIAGGLLWIYVRARGIAPPTREEWLGAAITGGSLLVLGNGIFSWSLQYIPSGIGALFLSLPPLFMAVLTFWFFGERITVIAGTGLLLGLIGATVLMTPSGASSLPFVPTLAAVASAIFWAVGSVLQRRFVARDVVQASAMQMLVSGAILAGMGVVAGERLTPASFNPSSLGALAFLIVFGSIFGYSCYLWLMRNASTTLASTYAYVNPIVAIAIGVLLLHESLGMRTVVAAVIILAGVALMVAAPKPEPRAQRRVLPEASEARPDAA
jgi:drug/metabolite transporter (DMT)-like permease